MSDEEIIARAIWQSAFPNEPVQPGKVYDVCREQAAASVAALRDAGRLMPSGLSIAGFGGPPPTVWFPVNVAPLTDPPDAVDSDATTGGSR